MEKEELAKLYRQYYNSLMVIACSYTHHEEDAKDLVHTTFLKALLSYKPTGSFLYWCNTVLRNEFYKLANNQRRFYNEEYDFAKLKSQDDLLAQYIQKEEYEELYAYISMLPIKFREVMIDSIYLKMSDEKIANKYHLKEANVRQIRCRSKELLKKMRSDVMNEKGK